MSPLAISVAAFACIFGGAFVGMYLRSKLPGHHLDGDRVQSTRKGSGTAGQARV